DAAAALAELLPDVAHTPRGEVAPATLSAGETCEIRPGEAVPADVRVVSGRSEVVVAIVTGEQAPRPAGPGDELPAGALNGDGHLTALVLRPAAQGTLGAIAALLEQPLAFTARLRLADRVAAWLVGLAVVLAAAGGALGWLRGGAGEALTVALAVLLVACPCGLGLAMPLAYRAMRAALARRGVLVRDAAALELAAQVDVVLLDKTGTLTELQGGLAVVAQARPGAGERLLATVARSGHRLAAGLPGTGREAPESLRSIPGCGVEGRLEGRAVRAGSPAWLADLRWDADVAAEAGRRRAAGGSLVAYAEDGEVVALAAAAQRLRPGAQQAIARLERAGLRVEIVSGDRQGAVDAIAAQLALPACAEARPETKLARVEQLQREGRVVLLAGDGVNDAPALRAADVGVALGSGTAVARGSAPVELVGDDLEGLALLLAGARRLRAVARGSVAWTLAYNGVALLAAAVGLLHPLVAVAAMIASSLAVALRSWRLLDWSPETTHGAGRAA
ncbi:MAG TPA: heavy metal translocating P-type ATPase, partial [Planctomycetota bacterium]|nr:heavy metal translocating P-type ATPase [Planctomycetota bacterium]